MSMPAMPTIPAMHHGGGEHGGAPVHPHQWMGGHSGHHGKHGHGHGPFHRKSLMMRNPWMLGLFIFNAVFWAAIAVCFVSAANRAASAQKTIARLKALSKIPEAFTDEERAVLIHKVKATVLGPC